MSILSDYKVRFSIKKFFNKDFKSMHTIDDMLTVYITDSNTVDRANSLINIINEVIGNAANIAEVPTQSMYIAVIDSNQTRIYLDNDKWFDNPTINADFTLPTSDFKVIVEAWRDYLQ